MAEIFISYSKRDYDWVSRLASALEAFGYSVWWDYNLGHGDSFSKEISSAISEAKYFFVIWTRHSVSSDWVYAETDQAWNKNKLSVVQFRVGECSVPLPYNSFHMIVIDHATDESAILQTIERTIGPPAISSSMVDQSINGSPTQALELREELIHWYQIVNSEEINALEHFISIYPRSIRATFAKKKIDDIAYQKLSQEWQTVKAGGRADWLKIFMVRHATSHYFHEASALLRQIENDDKLWNATASTNTIAACDYYLSQFPQGRHRAEIGERRIMLFNKEKQEIDATKQELLKQILDATDGKALKELQSTHSGNQEAVKAIQQQLRLLEREPLDWAEARMRSASSNEINAFIIKYPNGPHLKAAQRLVLRAKRREHWRRFRAIFDHVELIDVRPSRIYGSKRSLEGIYSQLVDHRQRYAECWTSATAVYASVAVKIALRRIDLIENDATYQYHNRSDMVDSNSIKLRAKHFSKHQKMALWDATRSWNPLTLFLTKNMLLAESIGLRILAATLVWCFAIALVGRFKLMPLAVIILAKQHDEWLPERWAVVHPVIIPESTRVYMSGRNGRWKRIALASAIVCSAGFFIAFELGLDLRRLARPISQLFLWLS
ncbi:MAG: toll/interleukin-1 receptor domain-containing protein [Hyphomicrobiaceae bacterium]|nr:toll/interleukin-1 receptor domain-containing protein [Hyphomicrobiaceae bacterium]